MKIPLQEIDEIEYGLFEEGYDGFFDYKTKLSKELNIPVTCVHICYHPVVDEWVVNVEGKFYGYVEDDYFEMN